MSILNSLIKKYFVLLLPLVLLLGCTKKTVTPARTQGYIIVECDNCKVQYGMPDQYKTFNISGTSGQEGFNYTTGYTLVAYITALGQGQNLTITVYDKLSNIVYHGTVYQATTGYWDTNTIMP